MTVINLNHYPNAARQLYKIGFVRSGNAQESNVYLLASSLEDAIDMFPRYFAAVETDPKVIPADTNDEMVQRARREIRRVERVADVVLSREESGVTYLEVSALERFAEDLAAHADVSVSFEPDPTKDGLHVLNVNNADFYFQAGTGGYDGWGKRLH